MLGRRGSGPQPAQIKNYRFIGTKQKPPPLPKTKGVPKDVSPVHESHPAKKKMSHFPSPPGAGGGTPDLGSTRWVLYHSTGLHALDWFLRNQIEGSFLGVCLAFS